MIMVPSQNIPNKHPYGCAHDKEYSTCVLSSLEGHEFGNQTMVETQMDAQDDSRTSRIDKPGLSFKEVHEEKDQESWLQLSIGGVHARRSNYEYNTHINLVSNSPGCCTSTELNILPNGSFSQLARPSDQFYPPQEFLPVTKFSASNSYSTPSLLFNQHQLSRSCSNIPDIHQDMDWSMSCRSIPQNTAAYKVSCSSSSSPSSLMPLNCVTRPFQATTGKDVAFRIMDAPRRPHSGIWFMLQASQNQENEPFLPQIPKCYLRIKDGRTQVRLVLKYLLSKLKLGCDSKIEITCGGQKLLPFFTLQHVRDNIWSPKDYTVTLITDTGSPSTDHIMVLHYGSSPN